MREPRVVILAAGASSRLGEPKALVDLGGHSALERLVAASGASEPPLVVTGAHHAEIAAARPSDCVLLENRAWAAGRSGGLGLAAAGLPGRDLLVAPIDVPLVPREVFDALRTAWAAAGRPAQGWLAPRRTDPSDSTEPARFGHPVVIGRDLVHRLVDLPPDTPLKRLRAEAEGLLAVDVDAIEVLDDLDRPEDLAALRARLG